MKPYRFYALLASALFAQGCTTPQVAPDQSSVSQATERVLQEAVYFSTLFASCAALGGDVEIEAISKQQDWLNANNKLLLAADQIYSQQEAANTFEYQGKTLAPNAIRLALDAKQRAVNELALNQRTPMNKVKTCEFRLGKITTATLDLAQSELIAPYAMEILKSSPLDHRLDHVPTLSGGITEVAPGATYYKVIKAHEATCPDNPFTLSIVNQWPNEVYANFCGDITVEVLSCDWGKCSAKKL